MDTIWDRKSFIYFSFLILWISKVCSF